MTMQEATSIGGALAAHDVSAVLTRDDPGFTEALTGFNTYLTPRPDAVVTATSEADVVGAVLTADELGLDVVPLGLGHASTQTIDGGIAISTVGLRRVAVDSAARTATVGAGTPWIDVIDAAAPFGLAPLAGSAPHVGVIGYLLGGGMGPVARTYGYAADHVRSLRVVTGLGEVVNASAVQHPDLFWALRGGKAGLGIVTEAVIDLMPLRTLQAGGLYFDGADATAVVHGFADWAGDLPESVSTSLAVLRLPPLPGIPEPLRGRTVVHVRLAVVGDAQDAADVVAPPRSWATPMLDTIGEIPYAALGSIHGDPVDPMPVVEGGRLLRGFDRAAADALLEVAGPQAEVPLAAVEIRLLGGALARAPRVPNAVGGRDATYSLHVVGAPVPDLLDDVVPAVVGSVLARLEPWATGGVQANFVGNANPADDARTAWPPALRARLRAIRFQYDPRGRFPYDGHLA